MSDLQNPRARRAQLLRQAIGAASDRRDGLFDQHVDARIQKRAAGFGMRDGRHGDNRGIGLLSNLIECQSGALGSGCGFGGAFGVCVADTGQFGVWQLAHHAHVIPGRTARRLLPPRES